MANHSYGCQNKGHACPEPIWATIPATALFAICDWKDQIQNEHFKDEAQTALFKDPVRTAL